MSALGDQAEPDTSTRQDASADKPPRLNDHSLMQLQRLFPEIPEYFIQLNQTAPQPPAGTTCLAGAEQDHSTLSTVNSGSTQRSTLNSPLQQDKDYLPAFPENSSLLGSAEGNTFNNAIMPPQPANLCFNDASWPEGSDNSGGSQTSAPSPSNHRTHYPSRRRMYQCSWQNCQYASFLPKDVKKHFTKHVKPKKEDCFLCPHQECEKAFARADNRNRHSRTCKKRLR